MDLQPKKELTEEEIRRGLKLVIIDGLMAEAMTTFTGGAFLVAMALLTGASNFQIGLLAALPTFTNTCQLLSIWLVRRFRNRRAITFICLLLARVPLLVIGSLPLLFSSSTTAEALIFFLFFYYFFGSIAGPSWNSWMKDLVPEKSLGDYFSRRGRLTQILNVVLSLAVALFLDYVKKYYAEYELYAYAGMFITGGIVGITGAFILSKTPERESYMSNKNIFNLFKSPLKNHNFRNLLVFNSSWVFALSLATPFFTVFMMKTLGLPLSYIIALGILSQLSSIFTIRAWGKFADRYSNKTIIAIGAPLYILCLIAWCFVGIYTTQFANLALLALIHICNGISTAGINLSLTNIGLKLAPAEDTIVYLSVKNIITAFFSSVGPLLGGYLADYFTTRHLTFTLQYLGPGAQKTFRLVSLHEWNFLFLIAALLALVAIQLLARIKETGEVEKDIVVKIMRSSIKNNLKDYFIIGNLISLGSHVSGFIRKRSLRK